MEYNEESDEFKILTIIHVKYASIFCGLFGLIITVSSFGVGLAYFPFAQFSTAYDVITLAGFVVFLISGVAVHYLILHAIHATQYRLLLPSMMFHSFLIGLNTVLCFIAIGELVSDQEPSKIDEGEAAARFILYILPITTALNSLILITVFKCRHYLQCKRRHIRNGQPPSVREVLRPDSAPTISRIQKIHPTITSTLVQQNSISSAYKNECGMSESAT